MNSSSSGKEERGRIILPKAKEILADPHVMQMRRHHEALLKQIVGVVGVQTDAFMKECIQLVFPSFVAEFIQEYSAHPDVAKAAAFLAQDARLVTEETANDVERMANARIRTVTVGPKRQLVGRLVITMKDGKLQTERTMNESIRNSPTSVYHLNDNCVRLFLWRLCGIPGCSVKATRRYQLFYGRAPEATAEDIKYADHGGIHIEGSADRV